MARGGGRGEAAPQGDNPRGLAGRVLAVAALAALITAAGGAAGFYLLGGGRGGAEPGDELLSRTSSAQTTLRQERLLRLRLISRLLSDELAAGNGLPPPFGPARREAPPPAPAPGSPAPEESAAADPFTAWLQQQGRATVGFDLAVVTDSIGRVLARSDRPVAAGESLAGDALLTYSPATAAPAGVWADGERLYLAVASPVVRDFDLLGYALAAYAVDERLALEVERIGGAQVVYVAGGAGAGPVRTVGASRPTAGVAELIGRIGRAGGELSAVLGRGEPLSRTPVAAGGGSWRVAATPLLDAAERPVGATVLAVPAARSGGNRILSLAGLGAGVLAALLISIPLALLVARRGAGPARRLAAVVEAARRGDYDHRVDAKGAGPLAPLAGSLDGLLGDLAEREALAAVTDAALLGGDDPVAAAAEPEEEATALVGVDLRRYASGGLGFDAGETAERLGRDLGRIDATVSARGGRVEAVAGHRVIATFTGEDRLFRAVAAGAEALAGLSRRESAFDEAEPPALAVAAGRVVRGGAAVAGRIVPTVVGGAVQLLDSLLREAGPGELLLAPPVHRELADRLEAAGAAVASRRGVLSPQPLFALDAAGAAPLVKAAGPAGGREGAAAAAKESSLAELSDAGRGAVTDPADLGPGGRLGDRFEILALVGTSSAGALFRARDRELGEAVALKVLKPGVVVDPHEFERHDGVLARLPSLVHAHLARTYDVGSADDLPYISREYVRGIPLAAVFSGDRRMPPPAALRLARQLAAALAAAHGTGVAHGRLTPTNVVLEAGGRLKITDFGVGMAADPEAARGGGPPQAPEQASGAVPGPRSDVYAAGALLYRALTGSWPPATGPAPPPAGLPEGLAEVLHGCLDPEPGSRFRSGAELLEVLAGIRA